MSQRAQSAWQSPAFESALAWYFVIVWGSGFLATKAGLADAPPFTFLLLRFGFGLCLLVPAVLWLRPSWPAKGAEWGHVIVAGLLMHSVNLGGSHYSQYLGMSAGVTALVLGMQPLATAVVSSRFLGERLSSRQWAGVALGLAGVALVVGHKIDVRDVSGPALAAVLVALAAVTAATLYQRAFCPHTDLRAAALIQFVACFVTMAPLAWAVEGLAFRVTASLVLSIAFLVIFASIFAVSALHTLMRRGHATRVTSLLYLTPVVAVALEALLYDAVPSGLTAAGIALACAGVALVTRR